MKRRFKTQFDKRPVKDGIFPCDNLMEGDGLDPRYDTECRYSSHLENINTKPSNRKALQLCSQVKDTLNLALSQFGDELIRDLYVSDVIPAPDSTQLLITLITENDCNEVYEALNKANGLLRSEVASGINRKRTPQLKFVVKH